MQSNNLESVQHIHFIGIGGIGVSAIARMMLLEGKKVTGSDISSTIVTEVLEDNGAEIFYGAAYENVTEDVDLVVYTIAIPDDNPELKHARELDIPTMTYPEALGLLSKGKYTVAVSGTHGKTTTTGMIAQVLLESGRDPSVIIGSFLKGYKSNFIAGKSDMLVVEACEYKRSFLNLHPNILVITNIAEDHLDYYENLHDIQNAFREMIERLPQDGVVVCNPQNETVREVVKDCNHKVVDYTTFTVEKELFVPGQYNIENAQCALAVASVIDIENNLSQSSLERFRGTWRRADHLGETENGAVVYDDYAHHPDEIKATLTGFKERFPEKKLIVAFQPHLYSRTKLLFNDFVESLVLADELIILPIYAAREEPDESITSDMLVNALKEKGKNVCKLDDFNEIEERLASGFGENDLIMTMGAGNVYTIGEKLVEWQNK